MRGEIRIEGLGKSYLARRRTGLFRSAEVRVDALRDVSLEIRPGEVFGLLGPNGAGKTTLIKCLTTLLVPTRGEAWINGHRLTADPQAVRAGTGCMLMGERGLYWKLTGRENLDFFGALYHLPGTERRRRAAGLIERFGLGEIADRAVETYSSGQRMKLSFAKSLVNDAPFLILDEPTNTLDPAAARELRETVRELAGAEGRTVLYTTHVMAEAEALCGRVAVMDRGRLLALGTVEELKAPCRGHEEVVRVEGTVPVAAREAVRRLAGVREAAWSVGEDGADALTVAADRRAGELLPRLIAALSSHGAAVRKVEPRDVTLEDVFLAHTGRAPAEPGAAGRAA